MCGLVSDALSAGPLPGLYWWVGVSLTGQPSGDHSILTCLFGFLVKMVLLLLVITQMKLTCYDFSLLVADNPASCGGRECQMLWMGNHDICCTPGSTCSAPSVGD